MILQRLATLLFALSLLMVPLAHAQETPSTRIPANISIEQIQTPEHITPYTETDRMVIATLAHLVEHAQLSDTEANTLLQQWLTDSATRTQLYTSAHVDIPKDPFWKEYFTLTNVLKIAGALLLAYAFSSYIYRLCHLFTGVFRHLWTLIAAMPPLAYQVIFGCVGLAFALKPALLNIIPATYVVIFGVALAQMMVLWGFEEYEERLKPYMSVIMLGMPQIVAVPLYFGLYYAGFAIAQQVTFLALLSVSSLLFSLVWGIHHFVFKKEDFVNGLSVTTCYLTALTAVVGYFVLQNIVGAHTPWWQTYGQIFESPLTFFILPVALLAQGACIIQSDDERNGYNIVAEALLYVFVGMGLPLFELGYHTQIAMVNSLFVFYLFCRITFALGKALPLLAVFVGGGGLYIIAMLIEAAPTRFIPTF